MTKISIVIPVFNAAVHLSRCIESLLLQTLENCEFIFVNDGSTDESRSILENYQMSDSRIIVINQQNQGVSAARNAGLQIAKGDYIGFVDADDTVEPNMFETLIKHTIETNADIVMSRYRFHQNGKEITSPHFFSRCPILEATYIKEQVIPFMIQTDYLNAIWTKIFKRDLIQDNQIKFPVGVALGEDGMFNLKAFSHAKTIYNADFAGYHYYENEGSATRDFASKDYFEAVLQEYNRDYLAYENDHLDVRKITRLKAEKFLSKSVSLIHEYTNPSNKLPFKTAYRLISAIITNPVFSQVLHENHDELSHKKSKYEKFILLSAHKKWVLLLFIATAYSRFRNQ